MLRTLHQQGWNCTRKSFKIWTDEAANNENHIYRKDFLSKGLLFQDFWRNGESIYSKINCAEVLINCSFTGHRWKETETHLSNPLQSIKIKVKYPLFPRFNYRKGELINHQMRRIPLKEEDFDREMLTARNHS